MMIKQKLKNYLRLNTDKYRYRWLKCRDLDLWNEILEATKFLPDNAKPKQRCWHVENDIWEIPLCPVTGNEVKWWDNRYVTYASLSAKSKSIDVINKQKQTYKKKTGKEWGKGWAHKTSKTYKEGLESGRIIPSSKRNLPRGKELAETIKKTFQEKYGVSNPMYVPEFREKMRKNTGYYERKENRKEREQYYIDVAEHTKSNWVEHYDKINPKGLNRSEYDLDHIFSIAEGFNKNVPPEIIGHWTNLRMLDKIENSKKGKRCDKSIDELYEDFENVYVLG